MSRTWNLDPLYLGFNDPKLHKDYQLCLNEAHARISESEDFILTHPSPFDLESFLKSCEHLYLRLWKLSSFASLSLSADTSNEAALALHEKVRKIHADLSVLEVRLKRVAGAIEHLDAYVASSDYLKAIRFSLYERAQLARHMLSDEEETLIAKLRITGSGAWETLYSKLTSTLMVDVPGDVGQFDTLPLSAVRGLAHDPDTFVRQNAYHAELAACQKIDESIAAALNAIKGEVLALTEKRGYATPLDATLNETRMSRKTLDALISAIEEKLPALRQYFKKKAELLGDKNGLKFHNLFAPIGDLAVTYTYEEAMDFVVRHFTTFNPELGAFATRARDEHWIDVDPRAGKDGGAFCSSLYPIRECRILTNFKGSLGDVLTLAHELGHGYHDYRLETQNLYNLEIPMTMAETASTFCETVVADAALATLSDDAAITVLESSLQDASQAIIDIYSRFLFETRVFEVRPDHALSVKELKEAMLIAQGAAYGDALDPEVLHPFMWLVKPHYYSGNLNFYNFPYAFGLLFAKGLYQIYKKEGQPFLEKYDLLLSESGKSTVEDICASVGIDVSSKEFWLASLDVILKDAERFMALADRALA
ncbi:MAG: M3 family oligoendopeptidase [Erysipelotrichaceae bacterium]|nr:M3 family oligoendopeptidase [Erysipelotrichaceae bacterium]